MIDPMHPLTNYKLLDDIAMFTDATCYESEMRYPTDPKILWEGIEKTYTSRTRTAEKAYRIES